jgi:small subunit ribosomal protein S17
VSERSLRRTLEGTVVSDKMDKTVVVRVERQFQHPTYKKYVVRSTKFMAHDETNDCHVGDRVRIVEHRPLSRLKRWRVQSKLSAATVPPKVAIDEGAGA